MRLLLEVVLCLTREKPIRTGYRPDWVSDRKPAYNCGQVLLPDIPMLASGVPTTVLIEPLVSEEWDVQPGDTLFAMEGLRAVASAVVQRIYRTRTRGTH